MKLFAILFALSVFSASASAEIPLEIQGVWIPDIEETLELMAENKMENIDFMRDRYLPGLRRIINDKQITNISGKRELNADISLKEKHGTTIVLLLSGIADGKKMEVELTIVPGENGRYIMHTANPADGSGSILWKKQQ